METSPTYPHRVEPSHGLYSLLVQLAAYPDMTLMHVERISGSWYACGPSIELDTPCGDPVQMMSELFTNDAERVLFGLRSEGMYTTWVVASTADGNLFRLSYDHADSDRALWIREFSRP